MYYRHDTWHAASGAPQGWRVVRYHGEMADGYPIGPLHEHCDKRGRVIYYKSREGAARKAAELRGAESWPVIFRMEGKGADRNCVAFFPYEAANYGYLGCYAHLGQHAESDLGYYQTTKAAKESDYADLLSELRGIYERDGDLTLRVVRRLPADWRDHAWRRF